MATVTLGTKAVGSIVKLKVDGVAREFIVIHQGKPSSSLYDASCDGTWLLMKDMLERVWWNKVNENNNSNNYKGSNIHIYLNNEWLNKLDAKTQSYVKSVRIPYVNGTTNSAVASGVNGLACKVFLLSGYEVGWTKSPDRYQALPEDGAVLYYFKGM